MCLAIPAQITEITGDTAWVEANGVRRSICVVLTPDIKPGDYVLVHAGYAITSVDTQEALKTLDLINQAIDTGNMGGEP